jgi:hypothetical protein
MISKTAGRWKESHPPIVENRKGFLSAWEKQIRKRNALEKWQAPAFSIP